MEKLKIATSLLRSTEEKKDHYAKIRAEHSLPLFFQPYWLDTVAGPEKWDIALSLDADGRPSGVWPYAFKRARGLVKVNLMPPLTPYLGPWLFYPENLHSRQKKAQFEEKVLFELAAQLPPFFFTQQKCHPSFRTWLPLYWQGYQQTTRYTYRIYPDRPTESLFSPTVRSDVRRSRKKMDIQEIDDPELFYRINALSFTQQGLRVPYDLYYFLRLDETLAQRNQRKITAIFDKTGAPVAGLYLVWDDDTVYYLASGIDRTRRPSGLMSYLLAVAIEKAQQQGKIFDFEGSMIRGVEKYFRSFGGERTPYHQITRGRNRWVEALKVIWTGRL